MVMYLLDAVGVIYYTLDFLQGLFHVGIRREQVSDDNIWACIEQPSS
jgi:hypothetical protein